jgi:ribosomal protection tetracycline resistance protein
VARKTLNLGILAHVDAGKTTLTERLLYAAGVIDAIGSVDDGTTQTDHLALERQRGITIKAAVASFPIGDVSVNLIDTPGHPDFIAEVERVLSVLDGAVLVVSAVEGVQAQTRVLMRALQRLRVPTLVFVNKIDRAGADDERVLRAMAERLTPAIVPLGSAHGLGTPAAGFTQWDATGFASVVAPALAEHDDALLAAYLEDETSVSYDALVSLTRRAAVHPVFFGSARTGAGVEQLSGGIAELLPTVEEDGAGAVSGTVFKVERGPAGEKIAYVRMFSGTLRPRDRVRVGGAGEAKVTEVQGASVSAGGIAKVWGLADVRIGDAVGEPRPGASRRQFAPPTLETVVVPRSDADRARLRVALAQLAEQDPLIDVRQDDARRELSVSLYGEVQKEVIQATLASDYGLDVEFRETTPIYIERPVGSGEAVELLGKNGNPFLATLGLRIERAPIGTGLSFALEVDVGSVPLYVYKSVPSFRDAVEEYVHRTLEQGLHGWQVTEAAVTMTASGYAAPSTTAGDFRKLTPLVLMAALKQAGTEVCEPIHSFRLEGPVDALPATMRLLVQLRAEPHEPKISGSSFALHGEIAAARMHLLQRQVGSATHGEGVVELEFDRYQPVAGEAPGHARTDGNPLNREEYLLHLARRLR